MKTAEVLADAFDRIQESVHEAVDGLPAEDLGVQLDSGANSIAWLVWHLARVQDDHVADAAGLEQVWLAQDWAARFGLPFADTETGYGQSAGQVAQVRADAALLTGYYDAVHEQTVGFVRGLDDAALDRVVDEAWSPPVTLGVRLISVIGDDLQHVGQAAFVRGVLERR
ncbi:DinB family protein [Streptomyces sp. NBC_00963]|uniref:mycothiol transferase n=1 Tax=unclassified Streptomyces TaxID=2593676 RepID=UPI0022563806|nr:DinB family protein [Streptomyces sp. NBC_01306]MCX4728346.1 DinB family protein [Streptomyces sp. NBC_01306]WSX40509.1 DinB family protein [Streptomyces sp. NBC_00963]